MYCYFDYWVHIPPEPGPDIRDLLFKDEPWRLSPHRLPVRMLLRRWFSRIRRSTVRTAMLSHAGRPKR